ncbi:hypothetical protein [Streptomyces sp. NPDC002559]
MDLNPKLRSDPDFWSDINALRDPAYTPMHPDDLTGLSQILSDTANEIASTLSTREHAYRVAGMEPPAGVVLSGDYQLALLHVLRQVDHTVQHLAAAAAKVAGHQGASYTKIGAAWGITRQSARLKWPDAVPARGEARPVELQLAGGRASITQLPEDGGCVWEATARTGLTAQGEEPYGSVAEAAAHAGAFLQRYADEDTDAHAECIEPHLCADGDLVDCDGRPL